MERIDNITATPDTAIIWRNQRLYLLDQRLIPRQEVYFALDSISEVATAIQDMMVRGAPAIGITAAYGVALGAKTRFAQSSHNWRALLHEDIDVLAQARPTAVNLVWALARMRNAVNHGEATIDPFPRLIAEAQAIHQEDAKANRQMGKLGAELITGPTEVITHCNAGALATGGYGTALGVVRAAYAAGKLTQVFAGETRPWLQGARLTTWELQRDGIPVTLIADSAAAARMAQGNVSWLIVGADRVAANGDVANKIGTYQLAIAARYHNIKVMVAAPISTVDLTTAQGADIPIEVRASHEVLNCSNQVVGPVGIAAWNPVFDITPATLVDALVTELGVILNPNKTKLAALLEDKNSVDGS